MRGTVGFILTASILAVITLTASQDASASASVRVAPTDLIVLFPAYLDESAGVSLATDLAARLGLGTVVSSESFLYDDGNPQARWFDGLNNSVPLRGYGAPAAPQKVVRAATSSGYVLDLHYSASLPVDGSNGSFLFAEVRPFPGNVSISAARDILRTVASSLGIVIDGEDQVREYVYGRHVAGDSLSVTLYRPLNGTSVGFANQVRLHAWTANGTIEAVRLFPWVSPTNGPSVGPNEAFVLALSRANASVNFTRYSLSEWEYRGFALDSRVYRLAYSYFITYPAYNITQFGTLHFLVWIDVQTGDVLLFDVVAVVPASKPASAGAALLYILAFVVSATALLVAAGLMRSESAQYSLFSFLTVAFLSLRRDRALEHFVRGQIYEYLRSRPGATFSDVRDDLSLNNGTAAHHLMVLEKMEFIVSMREDRLKHFFRGDTPNRTISISLSPLQYELLNALAQGELTQAELAARLGVSRQRVNRNVGALQRRRILTSGANRGGLRITPRGQSLLEGNPSGISEG